LNRYAQLVTDGELRSSMDSIPVRLEPQLASIIKVISYQLQVSDCSHVRFRECVEDFMLGIRWQPDAPLDACAGFYVEAYFNYFKPFMQERPHILENYLLNHIFRTRFPYGVDTEGKPSDPFTEYLVMC